MGIALSNEQRGTTVEVMIKIMDAAGLPLTVHGKVLPRHLAENLMTFVPRLAESEKIDGRIFALRTACYDIFWSIFRCEPGSVAAFVPVLHEGNANVHNLRVEIMDPIRDLAARANLHYGGGPGTDPVVAQAFTSAAPVSTAILFGPS